VSATRLLVLGCLADWGEAHGYRIINELTSWGAQEWANVKPGSIYHALKQATKEGLLEAIPAEDWPGRVDYRINEAGRQEFLRLLRDAIGQPDHRPDTISAGLAMLPALGRQEAIDLLEERIRRLTVECDEVEPHVAQREDLLAHGIEHVMELFHFWTASTQSSIAWTEGLVARLRAGAYVMADEDQTEMARRQREYHHPADSISGSQQRRHS